MSDDELNLTMSHMNDGENVEWKKKNFDENFVGNLCISNGISSVEMMINGWLRWRFTRNDTTTE